MALEPPPPRPDAAYLDRVTRLVEDWALLAGADGHGAARLRLPLRALPPPPRPEAWRRHSALCADGAPVELCETIAAITVGPAYTCDPGPYGADPALRLRQALGLAERLLEPAAGAAGLLAELRRLLFPPAVPLEQHTLWVGLAHGPGQAARVKLYWNLGWKTSADSWQRTLAALDATGCRPRPEALGLCAQLARRGFPRMLALSFSPGGAVGAKLSYRLARADLDDLLELAHSCGLPGAGLRTYVARVLRGRAGWSDDRAGVGVALDGDGGVEGLALYHYTWPYFQDHEALRRSIIAAAPAFGWDVQSYKATSRLLDGCRRSLLGFSLLRSGATGLHVYGSTGHLWR